MTQDRDNTLHVKMSKKEMDQLDALIKDWADNGVSMTRSKLVRMALNEFLDIYNHKEVKEEGNLFGARINPLKYNIFQIFSAREEFKTMRNNETDPTRKYFLGVLLNLMDNAATVERNCMHFIQEYKFKKASTFNAFVFKHQGLLLQNYFEKTEKGTNENE